ncbi:MAG: hypothetical protein HY308_00480 [Gammaproteobacteria bacterium]|nr:hypothetical protein [Gammaproteobacteria bacterium]
MEQQVDVVLASVNNFIFELSLFLPKLLGAIVILVVGWLVAKLLILVVVRGLKGIRFNTITEAAGLDDFLKKGGIRKSTIDVLGLLVYWLAILMTLLAAFNSFGLTVLSELFSQITLFIPKVISAVLILTIGLYAARFAADSVTAYTRNVGMQDSELMGRVTRYAIAVFVVIMALGQMDVGNGILYPAFLILFAGIVFALALAFGLGGQKWAADQLDKFSKSKK